MIDEYIPRDRATHDEVRFHRDADWAELLLAWVDQVDNCDISLFEFWKRVESLARQETKPKRRHGLNHR